MSSELSLLRLDLNSRGVHRACRFYLCFVALMLFAATTALSQTSHPQVILDPNATPALTSKTVILNGKVVPARILLDRGEYFISLDEFLRALGASSVVTNDTVVITSRTESPVQAANTAGRIKGTLTYFFNANYGDKPDVGSKIYLLSAHVCPELGGFVTALADVIFVNGTELKPTKYTVADGNGSFELTDVEPGEYTLMQVSNHAKAVNQRDIEGKVQCGLVQVSPGETKDESHDFGTSQ